VNDEARTAWEREHVDDPRDYADAHAELLGALDELDCALEHVMMARQIVAHMRPHDDEADDYRRGRT
jgi:hypothetical protein